MWTRFRFGLRDILHSLTYLKSRAVTTPRTPAVTAPLGNPKRMDKLPVLGPSFYFQTGRDEIKFAEAIARKAGLFISQRRARGWNLNHNSHVAIDNGTVLYVPSQQYEPFGEPPIQRQQRSTSRPSRPGDFQKG